MEEAMKRAFEMVCPKAHAMRLVKVGLLTAENAAQVTWRDRIAAVVTDKELAEAGVSIEQVKEAIGFYTATVAEVTRERIAAGSWRTKNKRSEMGYLVLAAGYRAGPAGP